MRSRPQLSRSLTRRLAGPLLSVSLAVASPWCATGQTVAAPGKACGEHDVVPGRVTGVDDRFDLALSDGRIATLPGIEFDRKAIDPGTLVNWLSGLDISIAILQPAPDRWGRRAVFLTAGPPEPDRPAENVAELALAQGYGRYRPDATAHDCRAALLRAEAQARENRRGLWSGQAAGPIDGADRAAVAASGAGFKIVEARVVSVGAAGGRIYLNLGPSRWEDLAIVILRRNMSVFEGQEAGLRRIAGHRIRARGLLDRRYGPRMEISSPDALEILDDGGPGHVADEARN